MNHISVQALAAHDYAGKRYKKDQRYECEAKDLKVLELAQLVMKVEPEESARKYKRRDMEAEK